MSAHSGEKLLMADDPSTLCRRFVGEGPPQSDAVVFSWITERWLV